MIILKNINLCPDKDGYYKVLLLNSDTTLNKYDPNTLVDYLKDEDNKFNRMIVEGMFFGTVRCIYNDIDLSGKTIQEIITIDQKEISHHIKSIQFIYNRITQHLCLYGMIKPYGPFGSYMQQYIDNNIELKFGMDSLIREDNNGLMRVTKIFNFPWHINERK